MTCVSTPISWPRLEAHALARDAAITAHLAECAACRSCMDEIERDVVALPPLPAAAAKKPRLRWWYALVPALAAAAILLFVLRPRGEADGVLHIKGVGEVVLELVRERAGTISFDAQTFAPGDRWKVVVTCPPAHEVSIRVEVRDGKTVDHPLAPATTECGNRVAIPGAFTLDGGENKVCVRIDDQTACLSVRPE